VPDPAAPTSKVAKATDIKYRQDPDGKLYISWTQPANAKATIGYFPGGLPTDALVGGNGFTSFDFTAGTGNATALFSSTDAGYLYPKNALTTSFPIIGGKVTIAIQTEYFNGDLYAKDVPARQDITLDQYKLDLKWQGTTPAMTVTQIYETATTGTVRLSWPRIQGDEDVYSGTTYSTSASNKVTYIVYKREIGVNQDGIGNATVPPPYGQVTSAWEKVTLTPLNDPSDGHGTFSDRIYAEEANVKSVLGSWQYMVFAEANEGSKKNHSVPLTGNLTRTLPTEATVSAGVAHGYTRTPDGYAYTNQISVGNLTAGVTYTLYRGVLEPILKNATGGWITSGVGSTISNYKFLGYETIADIPAWTGQPITGDTTAIFFDTGIVPRKTYIYKLVSEVATTNNTKILLGDGATSAVFPDNPLRKSSVYSVLSLDVQPLDPVIAAGKQTNGAAQGWVTAKVTNEAYTEGMAVKLYYRRPIQTNQAGTAIKDWELIHTFERNESPNPQLTTDLTGIFKPYDHEFKGDALVFGETYQFKAIAYLNDEPVPNLASSANYTGTVSAAATATSSLSQASITSSTLTTTAFSFVSSPMVLSTVISGISGAYLPPKDPIAVRIVRVTPDPKRVNFFDQGTFNLTETGNTGTYQFTLPLTAIPDEEDNDTETAVAYRILWKHPWQEWDDSDVTTNQRIQSFSY
jgi:hypothetical protein